MEYLLVMWLCSTTPGNECQLLKTELSTFKDNHSCTIYGYQYSLDLVKGLSKDFVNTYGAHTRFMCTEETKVET